MRIQKFLGGLLFLTLLILQPGCGSDQETRCYTLVDWNNVVHHVEATRLYTKSGNLVGSQPRLIFKDNGRIVARLDAEYKELYWVEGPCDDEE